MFPLTGLSRRPYGAYSQMECTIYLDVTVRDGFLATICLICWDFCVVCGVWLPSVPQPRAAAVHRKDKTSRNRQSEKEKVVLESFP